MLHDYHSEIIDDFDRWVARGLRSLGVAAPTGSGKAIIAFAFGASAVVAGQRILMLAHRRELIARGLLGAQR